MANFKATCIHSRCGSFHNEIMMLRRAAGSVMAGDSARIFFGGDGKMIIIFYENTKVVFCRTSIEF